MIVRLINNPYQVIISNQAYAKMNAYVELCDKEISWLGTSTMVDDTFFIHDVFLFKQKVSAVSTEIDNDSLADFLSTVDIETADNIRVWGHSHVNMDVTPSGQDDSQMDYFNGKDYFIRIIINKQRKVNIDVYYYASNIMLLGIDWKLEDNDIDKEEIQKEIEEKVSSSNFSFRPTATVSRVDWPENENLFSHFNRGLKAYGYDTTF